MKKVITIMCVAAAPILFAQEKISKASAEQISKEKVVEKKAPANKKAEVNKRVQADKEKQTELKKQEIKATEKKKVDRSAKSLKAN